MEPITTSASNGLGIESVVVMIEGEAKTGKTTLALTTAESLKPPRKLFHMDLDVGGFSRAEHRFKSLVEAGIITYKRYYLPTQGLKERLMSGKIKLKQSMQKQGYKELWYDQLMSDYITALDDVNIDTIVLDSWAQFWNANCDALLQEKQEKNPGREKLLEIEYGEANTRMRTMIHAARESGKNLILVAHLDDDRKDMVVSGEIKQVVVGRKFAGWRHVEKEIDLAIRTRLEPKKVDGTMLQVPHAVVRLSGLTLDPIVLGLDLENPTWDNIRSIIMIARKN